MRRHTMCNAQQRNQYDHEQPGNQVRLPIAGHLLDVAAQNTIEACFGLPGDRRVPLDARDFARLPRFNARAQHSRSAADVEDAPGRFGNQRHQLWAGVMEVGTV